LVPEFHSPMLFEYVFDDKLFSQRNKENRQSERHPTAQRNPDSSSSNFSLP
jgi:hypothetical protein